jgi:23S rRNA pseudouridine1911/1915/1917 synthase
MDKSARNDPNRLEARRALSRQGVVLLYEDNHLLCVSKPAGLLSQAGPPGEVALPELLDAYRQLAEQKQGRAYIGVVHRLDRNVSGALVFGKTSKATSRLAALFRERSEELQKVYLAWVEHPTREDEGTLVHMLRREAKKTLLAGAGDPDAKEARLHWRTEGRSHRAARLRVVLETGLPHQIRAQLSIMGYPIIGDVKYGGPQGKRPGLHALQLAFPHPVGGQPVQVVAPVPEDLMRLDRRLGIEPGL